MSVERLIDQQWFSSAETAELLQVNKRTVHGWVKRGDLEALRIGGRTGYRISEDAIERFLLTREIPRTTLKTRRLLES